MIALSLLFTLSHIAPNQPRWSKPERVVAGDFTALYGVGSGPVYLLKSRSVLSKEPSELGNVPTHDYFDDVLRVIGPGKMVKVGQVNAGERVVGVAANGLVAANQTRLRSVGAPSPMPCPLPRTTEFRDFTFAGHYALLPTGKGVSVFKDGIPLYMAPQNSHDITSISLSPEDGTLYYTKHGDPEGRNRDWLIWTINRNLNETQISFRTPWYFRERGNDLLPLNDHEFCVALHHQDSKKYVDREHRSWVYSSSLHLGILNLQSHRFEDFVNLGSLDLPEGMDPGPTGPPVYCALSGSQIYFLKPDGLYRIKKLR